MEHSRHLLDSVAEIDEFRRSVEESGNGTDPEAAWELLESIRSRLASGLRDLGEAVPDYDGSSQAPSP